MSGKMTKRVLGCVLLLAMCSCGRQAADASYDQAQAKAEIEKIERAWADVAVSGDPTVIESIFAEDFIGISPDGVRYTKQEFIEDTRAHPLGFTSISVDEIRVRFFGDTAVAQGHETFTRKDGGQGRFVWTDVLVRRDGKWQLVAAEDIMAATQTANAALFTATAQSDPSGIDKTRNAYVAAWNAADASKVADLYTDDAIVLYPDQPAVTGRKAILGYFKEFFAEFSRPSFELSSAEIEIAGLWAFDRGMYRWKGVPRAGGEAVEDSGKYLVILRQQADGEWKVARDMDNSDRSVAQSTRGTR